MERRTHGNDLDSQVSQVYKQDLSARESQKQVQEGFTLSIMVLALAALVTLAFIITRARFGMGRSLDYYVVPSMAALTFVLPLAWVGFLCRYLSKKALFNQAQLVTLYAIVSLGAVMLGHGGSWLIMGNIMAFTSLGSGYDSAARGYDAVYKSLLDRIPTFVVPRSQEAVFGFFAGKTVVPWDDWIAPILLWTLYFTGIFFVFLCIAVMLHRHWSEVLHLAYPLAEPVVRLTEPAKEHSGLVPTFWMSRLMWGGAVIPLFVGLWNDILKGLLLPGLSAISYSYNLAQYGSSLGGVWSPLLSTFPGVRLDYNPLVVGIGYLVGNDVLFSVSFFYVVAQRLPRLLNGITPFFQGGVRAWMYDQYYAGVIGFAVVTLYMSREQLKVVWARAMGDERYAHSDDGEGMTYRTALFGLIGGMVWVLLFNVLLLKVSLLYMIVFFSVCMALFLTFARSRVQLGIPTIQYNSSKLDTGFIFPTFGSKMFGMSAMAGSGFHTSMTVGFLGSGLASMFESYRMADSVGMPRKSMTKAILLGVVATLLIGFLVGLPFVYRYGFDQPGAWTGRQTLAAGWFPKDSPEGVGMYDGPIIVPIVQALALLFTGFLAWMYSTFTWWPFHPLGYVMGVGEISVPLWFSFFLAWVIKTLLLRYGGSGMYWKARPFFMGLIAGSAIWSVFVGILGLIPGVY